jgi:hypothetical protein
MTLFSGELTTTGGHTCCVKQKKINLCGTCLQAVSLCCNGVTAEVSNVYFAFQLCCCR